MQKTTTTMTMSNPWHPRLPLQQHILEEVERVGKEARRMLL